MCFYTFRVLIYCLALLIKKSKQVKKNADATVSQTKILLSNKPFQNKAQPYLVSFQKKKIKRPSKIFKPKQTFWLLQKLSLIKQLVLSIYTTFST